MKLELNYFVGNLMSVLSSLADLEKFKKMFFLILAQTVVMLALVLGFILLLGVTAIIFIGKVLFSGDSNTIMQAISQPNPVFLIVFGLILLIGFLALIIFGLIFSTAGLFIAKSILDRKLIGVKEAISKAKESLKYSVPAWIVLAIIGLIVFAVIGIPLGLLVLGSIGSLTAEIVNPVIFILVFGAFFVGIFLILIINMILSPIITLVMPTALFEESGPLESLRSSFNRARRNYVEIFIYLIIAGVITGIIGGVQWLFDQVFGFVDQFVIMGLMSPLFVIALFLIVPWFLFRVALSLLFASAIALVGSTLVVNLYYLVARKKDSVSKKSRK